MQESKFTALWYPRGKQGGASRTPVMRFSKKPNCVEGNCVEDNCVEGNRVEGKLLYFGCLLLVCT
ncbi:MAG: hypothetical protein PHQ75_10530 [Thermoguttaceae bacterium]|nr:hypothetical protein [Thermoguttaceae bacterium]